jgi:serine protease Do
MLTPIKMNQRFTYGFATLLGLASPALTIEPPQAIAPVPPRVVVEDHAEERSTAGAPPVEMPRENEVAPPAELVRPYLGIGGATVPDLLSEHLNLAQGEGVVIRTLDPAGPAVAAGLAQNDIVTKIAGKPVGSHDGLREAISGSKPGDAVEVEYIHRGESKTATLTLSKAPAHQDQIARGGMPPLERLREDGMPQDQARRIREAIEQNMRMFEDDQGTELMDPGLAIGRGMHQRMQQMLQGMEMQIPDLNEAPQPGINIGGNSSSSIRMLDDNGSVEIKSKNGDKQVRVFGKDGKVEWEGAYNTDEDKAAVPEDVRERIDRLNIDMDFKGNGIRLQMGPRDRR